MRVAPDRSPLCRRGMVPVWSADAIGTQTTDAGAPNMPMQPTAAREIVGFLTVVGGALAAADEQAVGPMPMLQRQACICASRHSCFDAMQFGKITHLLTPSYQPFASFFSTSTISH